MSRRSDVSKMLVSHHGGRAGSTVGSSAGQRRIARVSDNGSSVGSSSNINIAAVKRAAPASPSAVGSSAAASPTNKTENSGWILMRCVQELKKSGEPLYIEQLQVKVGKTHKLTKEFEELLKRHPKVQYDKEGKKFSFASPYEWLNGPASILTELRNNRQMKIDNEALSFHKDVASWIDELLEKRAVRGIRGTHTKRCKTYASSTGLYCDLYNPSDRCDACKALDGVVLYALGPDYLENVEMDVDIKQLWHNIVPTPVAAVSALMGGNKRPATDGPDQSQGKVKRRKPAGAKAPRIHKISNVHIYSAEELKEVLSAESASNAC